MISNAFSLIINDKPSALCSVLQLSIFFFISAAIRTHIDLPIDDNDNDEDDTIDYAW